MNCELPYVTARANAKSTLLGKKVVDKFNTILDYPSFTKEANRFWQYAKDNYLSNLPVTERLITSEDNKVIFNEDAFMRIDASKGVFYPANEKYRDRFNEFEIGLSELSDSGKVTNLTYLADEKSVFRNPERTGNSLLDEIEASRRILWNNGYVETSFQRKPNFSGENRESAGPIWNSYSGNPKYLSLTLKEAFNTKGASYVLGLGIASRLLQREDSFVGRLFEYYTRDSSPLDIANIVFENNITKPSVSYLNNKIYINMGRIEDIVNRFETYEDFVNGIDLILTEEIIHAVTFKVSTKKELSDLFNSLSNKEKTSIKQIYKSKQDLPDDLYGAEYVRMIVQDTAKQTITEVQESDVEAKVRELEKEGLLEIDCKGKLKAEKGLQTNFTKGGKWKLIKDLKGYPTHKEGGVDLTIGKNGVSIKNGNTEFIAKHGLVIPKN